MGWYVKKMFLIKYTNLYNELELLNIVSVRFMNYQNFEQSSSLVAYFQEKLGTVSPLLLRLLRLAIPLHLHVVMTSRDITSIVSL